MCVVCRILRNLKLQTCSCSFFSPTCCKNTYTKYKRLYPSRDFTLIFYTSDNSTTYAQDKRNNNRDKNNIFSSVDKFLKFNTSISKSRHGHAETIHGILHYTNYRQYKLAYEQLVTEGISEGSFRAANLALSYSVSCHTIHFKPILNANLVRLFMVCNWISTQLCQPKTIPGKLMNSTLEWTIEYFKLQICVTLGKAVMLRIVRVTVMYERPYWKLLSF